MPNEQIIYFGDTAHLPYGDKSKKAIEKYSLKITDYLISKGCKLVVIACNTSSAYAYDAIKTKYGNSIDIVNVIDPMVELISSNSSYQNVGVIGTKGTISSNIYQNKIADSNSSIVVASKSTALLAPLVEENFSNTNISKLVIEKYLKQSDFMNIEALVLGCTHYPLLTDDFRAVLGRDIDILDSSKIVASKVEQVLRSKNLLSIHKHGHHEFFISDYTDAFERNAKIFFGKEVHLEKKDLWV